MEFLYHLYIYFPRVKTFQEAEFEELEQIRKWKKKLDTGETC